MVNKHLVSVCCITYNHEDYIRDTIEGFLMQEADFPIEIIIHDDASTDNTQEIIKEYAEKDDRILPILREENIKSTGVAVFPITFEKARGKYIAMCEGDDYWTDPLKLQKQVEFMEENEDCSLCFHAAQHEYEGQSDKNRIDRPDNRPDDNKFSVRDAILEGGSFMATCSMFFKKKYIKELPKWYYNAPVGDIPLMLILAANGNIGYIDEVMSVYRRSVSGSWTEKVDSLDKRRDHYHAIRDMWDDFNAWSNYEFDKFVNKKKTRNTINFWKEIISYRKSRVKKFFKRKIPSFEQ